MATRKAQVGEQITSSAYPDGAPVNEGCEGSTGYHLCASHPDADIRSNLGMNGHVEYESGPHIEVWVCHEHGPEVP